jgi:cell division protein FtsX
MKIVKITAYALLVSVLMFLGFLRRIALRPAADIEAHFNISAALDGTAATEVVADRILSIEGVKDVRVKKSEAIFEEYRRDKIISEKIRLEENPFSDSLNVYPEALAAGVDDLAAKIASTGGVEDIAYERRAVTIYRRLKVVAGYISIAASAIAAGAFIIAAVMIGVKIKASGAAGALKTLPYLFYLVPVSAVCYAGFMAIARLEGFPFDYAANGILLAAASAIASVVYAE